MQFSSRYKATPYAARRARLAVVNFGRTCGFLHDELFELETAVGEAIANAVEHGNRLRGYFLLSVRFEEQVLTVEVQDSGDGFLEPAERLESRNRGFGIPLMRALVDELTFHEGGRCIRLRKRLRLPSANSSWTAEERRQTAE